MGALTVVMLWSSRAKLEVACLTLGESLPLHLHILIIGAEKVQALNAHSFIHSFNRYRMLMSKPPMLDSRDHTKEGLSWAPRDYKSLVICPSSYTSTEYVSVLGVTGWGSEKYWPGKLIWCQLFTLVTQGSFSWDDSFCYRLASLSLCLLTVDQGTRSLSWPTFPSVWRWGCSLTDPLFPWSPVADEEGYSKGLEGKERIGWTTILWYKNKRCCFGDSLRERMNKEQSEF